MQRQALRSRGIVSVGYDPEASALEIEFRTGRVYRYHDVPESVHAWLLRAKNKGSFVSKMISPKYAYTVAGDERAPRGTAPDDLLAALQASLSR